MKLCSVGGLKVTEAEEAEVSFLHPEAVGITPAGKLNL